METFPNASPAPAERLPDPPESITIEQPELKTNDSGKQYAYEKNGTYYGGDYLPEPPDSINLNDEGLPPPPPEIDLVG